MLFFDNKHKVTQEIYALHDRCDTIRQDISKLAKLLHEISRVVEDRAKLQVRKDNDDEILLAILARPTDDKTH